MAIKSFDKDAVVDYVPRYGDNRDSDDPCVVRIMPLSFSRAQHYARVLASRSKGISNREKLEGIAQEVQKKQFVEHVESVSGYFVGDREVTNPDEFYETADTDLVFEIIRAMESHSRLSEGQRENFQSASASSSSAPTEALSIAPSAKDSSEKVETVVTGSD